MNAGPLTFLGILASVSASWFGMVFMPQLQLGGEQPQEIAETGQMYPSRRAGLAEQGAEVYRANGCYYCHTQQVSQDSSDFDISLTDVGAKRGDLGRVLQDVRPDLAQAATLRALGTLPTTLKSFDREFTEYFTNLLGGAGAKISVERVTNEAPKPAPGQPEEARFGITISALGANAEAVAGVVRRMRPSLGIPSAPVVLARGISKEQADDLSKRLQAAGAKVQVTMNLRGVDMDRGWGRRRSVAADYLYDHPVMVGSRRMGPDLSNIGDRQPSRAWHMAHLYNPRSTMSEESPAGVDSLMPAYPYLFTRRPRQQAHHEGHSGHSDAIHLVGGDYDIVPKPEAEALVAYLLSLKSGPGVFEAPIPKAPSAQAPSKPAAAAVTPSAANAPAAGKTPTVK